MAAGFVARLKQILKNSAPDLLFVEPSGMVITREMRNVSTMALRDVAYEIGPFVTLVDSVGFDETWAARRELLLNQIREADLVAVSRVDLVEPEEVVRIQETLGPHASKIKAVSLRREGVRAVLEDL